MVYKKLSKHGFYRLLRNIYTKPNNLKTIRNYATAGYAATHCFVRDKNHTNKLEFILKHFKCCLCIIIIYICKYLIFYYLKHNHVNYFYILFEIIRLNVFRLQLTVVYNK